MYIIIIHEGKNLTVSHLTKFQIQQKSQGGFRFYLSKILPRNLNLNNGHS